MCHQKSLDKVARRKAWAFKPGAAKSINNTKKKQVASGSGNKKVVHVFEKIRFSTVVGRETKLELEKR